MTNRESTHGGHRPGAGRQPIGTAPRKTVSASLDPQTLAFVAAEAERAGVSRSAVIEHALVELQIRIAGSLYEPDYTLD